MLDLTTIGALLVAGVIMLWMSFYIHQLETKIMVLRSTKGLESKLPIGTKFYYDAWTGGKCVRCNKGKIAIRERYQTSRGENGKLVLDALPRVHWCVNCKYRNTSLELEEKTNLK